MKLETAHFGEIDVEEAKILDFGEGLPGFPDDRQFVLLEGAKEFGGEESTPFFWLQSVSNGDVAFILMDVFSFMPDYKPVLNPADFAELGEYNDGSRQDFLIYNIVVLPEDVKKMSVNLVAPVIINQTMKKGKQIVASNSEYNVRHYLFDNMAPDNGEETIPG